MTFKCNRCNATLPKPGYCPNCKCPEYRIEGMTAEERDKMDGTRTKKERVK
jgi:hypothetical protein